MASKDSNEDEVNKDNSEDNFGLPDLDYKPLDEPTAKTEVREQVVSSETYSEERPRDTSFDDSSESISEDEPRSNAPLILTIVIVLVLAVAGYLIYNFVWVPRQLAKEAAAKKEQADAALKEKQAREALLARQAEEKEKRRLDSLAKAKPLIGTIETLSGRTKRYYVVVTSDIDDDLLMDYAKKLSLKGISTKIIPPFGTKQFSRLTISDYDTFALAQSSADAVKGEYGDAWVIKY